MAKKDNGEETLVVVAETAVQPVGAGHTKQRLITSVRYAQRSDLLKALLENGRLYTCKDVDKLIAEYEERKV